MIKNSVFIALATIFFASNADHIVPKIEDKPMEPTLAPLSSKGMALVGFVYEHYKGNKYEVIALARDSETLEEKVVYRSLSNPADVWVRPLDMFCEEVLINGIQTPRFRQIK